MASGNVNGKKKMIFSIWCPDKYPDLTTTGTYYRNQDGTRTSKQQKSKLWSKYLRRICPIGSMKDLQKILEHIKLTHKRGTRYAVDYNFSVDGVKPCWDDAPIDRIIFADINLASDPQRLSALLNKWGRLAEILFKENLEEKFEELGANVKCITINLKVDRYKIFVWTTKLSRNDLAETRDNCQKITNQCEQQIELVWGPKYL